MAHVDSSPEKFLIGDSGYLAHVYQRCYSRAAQRHVRSYLSGLYDRCNVKVEERGNKLQDLFLAQLQIMHDNIIEMHSILTQTNRRLDGT